MLLHKRGVSTVALLASLVALIAVFALLGSRVTPFGGNKVPIACTLEAKQCPDGSYVVRTGPHCEFALCPAASSTPPVVCSMVAKLCPDGSYVHPVGPKCEFPACPSAAPRSEGTLEGTMAIAPICPVERIPPDPRCQPTPEMYAAHQVYVYDSAHSRFVATLIPDATGHFSAVLPVGTYVVDVQHRAIGGARDLPKTIVIKSGETVTISIDIDTGIR